MTLEEIKKIVNQGIFSKVGLEAINQILDSAIQRGGVTEEEKQRLIGIVEVEMNTAILINKTISVSCLLKRLASFFST